MRKLKIVEVAPWEETVPPKKYGGTELVVFNVTEGLVERGHEVFLLGAGTSSTKAKYIPLFGKTLRETYSLEKYSPEDVKAYLNYWKFAKMPDVLKIINDIAPDIVHNHLNWRLVTFSDFIKSKIVTTLHGPLTSINETLAYNSHKDQNYISISYNQRKALPDLNWVKTVYNGIDVEKFTFGEKADDYFVFLGRTNHEKGLKEICQIIKNTDHKLKIAAKVDHVDLAYFKREIEPMIDGKQIEFLGEVDHEGKNRLLEKAKALLLWLNWEEPFGLVIAEANACGTPIIVNRRGSMPELIKNGVTGYLVDSLEEMRSKLDEVDKLSRPLCRQHVLENFSKEKMVDAYLEAFESILDQNA